MRPGGVVGAAVAVLASGIAAVPAPASTANCGPAHARTLASSSQARVYERSGGLVYGCAGTRQFRLGTMRSGCNPCVGKFVVAGTVAAYVKGWDGYDNNYADVLVRRLTDGKRLASYAGADGIFQKVPSLVARPDGHVAWIGVGSLGGTTAVNRDGHTLDSGHAIRPHSLRLHGTRLSWKHGSKTRHARLS